VRTVRYLHGAQTTHARPVSISYKEVGRKAKGGKRNVYALLGRHTLSNAPKVAGPSIPTPDMFCPKSSTPPSLDQLESMADTGNFGDMPPVIDVIDSLDLSSPALLFTRIRNTLLKKIDHDKQQKEADRLAEKKRKESHSATVCGSSHAFVTNTDFFG
jgi:hypothetical protein